MRPLNLSGSITGQHISACLHFRCMQAVYSVSVFYVQENLLLYWNIVFQRLRVLFRARQIWAFVSVRRVFCNLNGYLIDNIFSHGGKKKEMSSIAMNGGNGGDSDRVVSKEISPGVYFLKLSFCFFLAKIYGCQSVCHEKNNCSRNVGHRAPHSECESAEVRATSWG